MYSRATDVTEYNLKQIFYQILHGIDHKPKLKDKDEDKITEIIEENNEITNEHQNNLANVKIYLLSSFQNLRNLPSAVNILWVSTLMADFFSKDVAQTLSPKGACVIFEGIKYNPNNGKDNFDTYEKKIKGLGQNLGENSEEIHFDAAKDNFAKFLYKGT